MVDSASSPSPTGWDIRHPPWACRTSPGEIRTASVACVKGCRPVSDRRQMPDHSTQSASKQPRNGRLDASAGRSPVHAHARRRPIMPKAGRSGPRLKVVERVFHQSSLPASGTIQGRCALHAEQTTTAAGGGPYRRNTATSAVTASSDLIDHCTSQPNRAQCGSYRPC